MKLGYIDYLNCYPFYFHMFQKKPIDGIEVIPGYPADLNQMMISGKLDMSPISAAACADLQKEIVLLPDFCLSSVGYVGSVILRSKVPIEDLHGRLIGMTSASHTSVVLLKILLHRYYDVKPVYRATDPNPALQEVDAALLIGNEAMIHEREPVSYSYDLGELWFRKTGFPVVFAVFAIRQNAIGEFGPQIRAVIDSYRRSLECLKSEKDRVIVGARKRYPNIAYDLNVYYRLLQFDFTDELKRALRFYLDTASEMGLLSESAQLRYLELAQQGGINPAPTRLFV